MKALLAQLRIEITLTVRNGEQLLVNLFIPLGLLVFFSKVEVLNSDEADPVQFLSLSGREVLYVTKQATDQIAARLRPAARRRLPSSRNWRSGSSAT